MSYFLCDTDFLFEYVGGNKDPVAFFKTSPFVFTSIITYSEMILACTNKIDKAKMHKKFSNDFSFLAIEREISDSHVKLLDQ